MSIKIGGWTFDREVVLEHLRESVVRLEEKTGKLPVAIYVNKEFQEKVLDGLEDLHGISIKIAPRLKLGQSLLVNEQMDRDIQKGVASFSIRGFSKREGWIYREDKTLRKNKKGE